MPNKDLCITCTHNISPKGLNCELFCYGVAETEDDDYIVTSCEDYEKKKVEKDGIRAY